ncbi:hypothetical protein J437_LFUL013223 [Ladona fulva]|uniref:Uncharacterized protein n=1 Tax=Ladona fulva TaxID=123851 RepID=A0A8K0KGT6_LADFU|nr:hypothetical protein J437_LFUL013223 [Ladona fulva]
MEETLLISEELPDVQPTVGEEFSEDDETYLEEVPKKRPSFLCALLRKAELVGSVIFSLPVIFFKYLSNDGRVKCAIGIVLEACAELGILLILTGVAILDTIMRPLQTEPETKYNK